MKLEPPAEMRSWGAMTYQMFVAMVDAGFTEDQALRYLALLFAVSNDAENQDGN